MAAGSRCREANCSAAPVRSTEWCLTAAMRPESRGHVHIAAADPRKPPAINFNFLSSPPDAELTVRAVRIAREIMTAPAMTPLQMSEIAPGADRTTDDEILDWVRNAAETTYHPVGTCKMGSDPVAVVDSRLRVHGIKGLRIADASIMPTLTSGNTDAPSTLALVRTRRRPRSPSRPSRRIPHHSLTGQCFGGVVVQIALGEGPVRGIKSGARCQG
jgi:hypothetical protein